MGWVGKGFQGSKVPWVQTSDKAHTDELAIEKRWVA